jgi:hypothetical protein
VDEGKVIQSVLNVFVFGSAFPLCVPLPLADIVVTLSLTYLRAHVLPNNLYLSTTYTASHLRLLFNIQRLENFTALIYMYSVRYEVLTAVVMKSSVFWDITRCSPLKVNVRFGGTCHLHLQD